MTERIVRRDADGLSTLTLNRPEKLNALDTPAFEQLDAHLTALASDERIGCIVVRGAGRCFCAGADLKALVGAAVPAAFKPGVIERLGLLPQPVIAAVHGVCFTGALELALACDFIVADATARFADTHGKWGLVSQWGMSQRLPRRIGAAAAKLMMMTGRIVEAAEAHRAGLVDLLAPAGGLDELVAKLAADVLANSWHTNLATKRLMRESDGLSLAQGLAHEHYRHPGFAADHEERIARFSRK
ncbi:MAG TPA: enoyl-CoA hydratase/isomerase family protein [Steroidobacteraceae bacterium]|nr:enoyl-CoA hydratase/isomerase family protein [Steroidobacteraceae bacterium]